jgi:ArsR family transcriptional regulator, zinc-responsive transcriptional repressor
MINKTQLLPMKALKQAAECLRVLSHPVRLLMLQVLREEECTVGELAEICEIKNNVASEHLRLMQRCSFLKARKEKTQVFYTICEPHIFEILGCIEKRFSEEDVA